jgi:hypothetical protein
VKACNAVVYVQNRSPHRILGDKTSKEEFIGVKPEIGYLRILSSLVYIHVHVEKSMKMDPSK